MNDQQAIEQLRKGQLVLLPSDIGWVIGADATQEAAIQRLRALMPTTSKEPLTLLVAQAGWLQQYVTKVPEIAWDLVEFAEKPLTVLYAQAKSVAANVPDSNGRVAIRVLKAESPGFALLNRYSKAIATFPAGHPDRSIAKSLEEIPADIRKGVDGVVDHSGGEKILGKLPTLVQLEWDGQIKFLRK